MGDAVLEPVCTIRGCQMPEGFFGQARPFLAGILPYGKENERSLPEKAPGRSCSMVVHTGS